MSVKGNHTVDFTHLRNRLLNGQAPCFTIRLMPMSLNFATYFDKIRGDTFIFR